MSFKLEIDHINFLVRRKFPQLKEFLNIAMDPKRDDLPEVEAGLLKKVTEYRAALEKLSDEELSELYKSEYDEAKSEEESNRFFNQDYAEADFDYWTKMSHWTLDEAIVLLFGKSPSVVNEKSLAKHPATSSPFVREYERTKELANRAVAWGDLYDPVSPPLFVKWAQDKDLSVPEELAELVEARHDKIFDWKLAYDQIQEMYDELHRQSLEFRAKHGEFVESAHKVIDQYKSTIEDLRAANQALQENSGIPKPFHTKEKESLLKMVIGMAVAGYAYDPAANRSPTSREIADDLATKGIQLDEDTVRRWLKEAKDHLPGTIDDGPE